MEALDALNITNTVLIGVLMFGMGNACDLENVRRLRTKPHALVIGSVVQLVLLPFLGWLVLQIIPLQSNLAVAVIVTASMPGGTLSNVVCLVFQLDISLSVAMTTFSSMISLGMIPLNLLIYLSLASTIDTATVDWVGIGLTTAVVVVGTIAGLVAKMKVSEKISFACQQFGLLAGVAIGVISAVINALSNAPLWELPGETYVVVALIPIIAAVLGLAGALIFKLEKQETSTIMVEASVQNSALALGIVLASIPDPLEQVQALGVPLVYATLANAFTVFYAIVLFKLGWSYGDAKENPCLSFLRKNYGCCKSRTDDGENGDVQDDAQDEVESSNEEEQTPNRESLQLQ